MESSDEESIAAAAAILLSLNRKVEAKKKAKRKRAMWTTNSIAGCVTGQSDNSRSCVHRGVMEESHIHLRLKSASTTPQYGRHQSRIFIMNVIHTT